MEHRMKWRRHGNGRIVIDPIKVRNGDKIKWDAGNTDQPLALFFPDGKLFGTHQIIVHPGKPKTTAIRMREKTWAIYPYAAYFVEFQRFGEGSTPIIVVTP